MNFVIISVDGKENGKKKKNKVRFGWKNYFSISLAFPLKCNHLPLRFTFVFQVYHLHTNRPMLVFQAYHLHTNRPMLVFQAYHLHTNRPMLVFHYGWVMCLHVCY